MRRALLTPLLLLLAAPALGAAPALTLKQGSAVDASDTVKSDLSIAAANVSAAADTWTSAGHSLTNGETVILYTSGTLPSPLAAWTEYWVVGVSGDTFQLASESGGTAIDLTDQGTGTHTVVWLLTEAELDANFKAVKNAILEAPDDETRAFGDDADVKLAWDSAAALWEWRDSADAVKGAFDPSTGYLSLYGMTRLGSEAWTDWGNAGAPTCTGVADSAGRTALNTLTYRLQTCIGETATDLTGPMAVSISANRQLSTQEVNRGITVYAAAAQSTTAPINTYIRDGARFRVQAVTAVSPDACPHSADQVQLRGASALTAGTCVENTSAAAGDMIELEYNDGVWHEYARSGTWASVAAPPAAFCSGTYTLCYDADHASGDYYAYIDSGGGSPANGSTNGSPTVDAAYGVVGNGVQLNATSERIEWTSTGDSDKVNTAEGTVTLQINPQTTTGTNYLFAVWINTSNRILAYINSSSQVVLWHQGNGTTLRTLTSTDTVTDTANNTVIIGWSVTGSELGININGGTTATTSVSLSAFAAGSRSLNYGDKPGGLADVVWMDGMLVTGTYDL